VELLISDFEKPLSAVAAVDAIGAMISKAVG